MGRGSNSGVREGSRRRLPPPVAAKPAVRLADAAAVVATLLFVGFLQIHPIDDSDTWWHLASGRRIAATGSVAHTDPFSFTAAGAPWVNRQWLFDLGLYGMWRLGGPAGLSLAAGALFVGGFGCAFVLARRRLPRWGAAVLVALAALVATERFVVRPEAVTFLCLALYLLVLDGHPGPRALAGLVALQVLWANLHALSVLGVAVLTIATCAAAAARWLPLPAGCKGRADLVVPLALATGCAMVAEAATPFGIDGALFSLRLLGVLGGADVTSLTVLEHRPPVLAELAPPVQVGLVAWLTLSALAVVIGWRRLDPFRGMIAAAFLVLALLARRNVALLGLGMLPLVADGLAGVAAAIDGRSVVRRAVASILAASAAIAAAAIVTGRFYDTARLSRRFGLGVSDLLFPPGAVEYLAAHPPPGRLFNDDLLGGFLLWHAPERKVFIDGRMQVYPPDVFEQYHAALSDVGAFQSLAAAYEIRAALLYHPGPGRLELAARIARLPGWRVAYLDGGSVLLVADGVQPGVPDGLDAPIPPQAPRALAGVQIPGDEATLHYQRGRAALVLLGPIGRAAAAADFAAALHLWPDLQDAALGLRLATESP